MCFVLLLVLIVLLPSSGVAAETLEIKNIYADMYKYMINKDISELNEILDDSFVLVHMTGIRQNKQEYLKAIADGTLNYYSEKTKILMLVLTRIKLFLSVRALLMLLYLVADDTLGGLNLILT